MRLPGPRLTSMRKGRRRVIVSERVKQGGREEVGADEGQQSG